MFGKRGAITLITMLEIILGVMLALLFFSAASSIGDQDRLNEFARAKDVALLIDSIQAVNNDVHYEYPETSFGTNIKIENLVVTVIPDKLRVPKPEFFSTSQYGLSFTTPSQLVIPAVVNGAFFVINKQGDTLSFSNDTALLVDSASVISSMKRSDVVLSIMYESQTSSSSNSFLTRLQNSIQGQLQKDSLFAFQGEPTHYLGLSLGDTSAIYHSDTTEMKALAQELQKRFLLSGKQFVLIPGTPLFEESKQAIQISFTSSTQQQVTQTQSVFALEVRQVYETFFRE